jgi:cytochrome c-type biogenesis protein CcmH
MTRIDDLKAQLAELDALVRNGTLTGKAARQQRDRLEAEVLAAVLKTGATASADVGAEPADAPAAKPSPRLLLGLATFVLAFGAVGYAWLGHPEGLTAAPGQVAAAGTNANGAPAMDKATFEAMTAKLAERLKSQPDDAVGWSMLGRSYSVLEQYPQALQAYRRVIELRPQEAAGYADLADALGSSQAGKLDGEPEKLIARALQLDPDHVKALALSGTIAFDRGDAALAARQWAHALAKAEPGSEMARQLQDAVDEARKRAGLPPATPTVAAAGATSSSSATSPAGSAVAAAAGTSQGASVQVRISLSPALAAKAAPDDTLFIFARALQGPKAPLAIQRRQVKDLPLDITLDDSMAMSPALRLSSVPQVVIGARISKSGNAMPQPGDLQGLTPTVAVGARGVALEIGEVVR